MSTLRPEELVRKAIAAGYGNPVGSPQGAGRDDDTCTLAYAVGDFSLGDWVSINGLQYGYPRAQIPQKDGDPGVLGVVQHTVRSGEWVRVKTCGATVAKLIFDTSRQVGDLISTIAGSVYAKQFDDGFPCGRYLAAYSFNHDVSVVEVGAGTGGGQKLRIHHHDDARNTKVTDLSKPSLILTAPLWMVWKVVNIAFTGQPDPRLMHTIGGGHDHGDLPWEGWAWGGVIGDATAMGFGELGGNSSDGQQGVLGAEVPGPSSDHDPNQNRINVRSYAGFNARDRYGKDAKVVGPIRFTYCATEFLPTWFLPEACDCVVGGPVTTGEPCDVKMEFWGGTMKRDTRVPPHKTNTGWQFQWTPQLPVERDCDWLEYKSRTTTPADPSCNIMDPATRLNIELNARSVAGGYESIVPWNYQHCPGRLDTLRGLTFAMKHIQALWRALLALSDSTDAVVACQWTAIQIMKNFFSTKQNGVGAQPSFDNCCPSTKAWQAVLVTGGPDSKEECQKTDCHQAPPAAA